MSGAVSLIVSRRRDSTRKWFAYGSISICYYNIELIDDEFRDALVMVEEGAIRTILPLTWKRSIDKFH